MNFENIFSFFHDTPAVGSADRDTRRAGDDFCLLRAAIYQIIGGPPIISYAAAARRRQKSLPARRAARSAEPTACVSWKNKNCIFWCFFHSKSLSFIEMFSFFRLRLKETVCNQSQPSFKPIWTGCRKKYRFVHLLKNFNHSNTSSVNCRQPPRMKTFCPQQPS